MIILSPYLVYVKKIDIIFFHTLLMKKNDDSNSFP